MLTGLLLTACPQHFRNRDTVSVRLWFPSVNCSRTWVLCMVAYSGAYISSTSPFLTLVTTELMTHRVGFLKIINWLLLPHYKGQDGRTCGAIFVPAPLTHCLYSCEPVFFKCFFHFLHCNFRFSHHHIFQLDEKKKKNCKTHPQRKVALAQKLKQQLSVIVSMVQCLRISKSIVAPSTVSCNLYIPVLIKVLTRKLEWRLSG